MKRRVLICGGRDFADWDMFCEAMKAIADFYLEKMLPTFQKPVYNATIISGCATGADSLAINWATMEYLQCLKYPADWSRHGKRAGYIRNKQMLAEGKLDLVVAFPGGKGTAMMKDLAVKAGVLVLEVSKVGKDNICVNELNPKPVELQTEKYKQIYIDKIQQLRILTPGQKAGIFRELIEEEKSWLANMDKDYNEIMEAVEAFDKTQL